jgi:hypothetical protein
MRKMSVNVNVERGLETGEGNVEGRRSGCRLSSSLLGGGE